MIARFRSPPWIIAAFAVPALSAVLAFISTGGAGFSGWTSFLLVLVIGSALGALVFRALKHEKAPPWLVALTLGAALLRLLAGLFWFTLLPQYGYETPVQQAGYVMEDAFNRDRAAWVLADSDAPLWAAFRPGEHGNFRSADQYGGLLFLSAATYRLAGADSHHPLLIVALSAIVSALAVPLSWAFARRLFGDGASKWAAWGLALYPEAVLLGSSQMREAWIMPLAAAAFLGLAVYAGRGGPESKKTGLIWVLGALAFIMPLSPPFAGILAGLLGLTAPGIFRRDIQIGWRFWAILGLLAVGVIGAIWLGWGSIAPLVDGEAFGGPLQLALAWLRDVSRWQAHLSEASSGWLQKIFDSTPEWADIPFLVAYGVTRPLLPAQLVATGAPVWTAIGIWRAAGWTVLLLVLLYAPFQALREREDRALLIGLSLAVWTGIIFASFWGGGDQWDNPRYRVGFIAPQIVLASQVLATQVRKPDPWLRRIFIVGASVMIWFLPWYLRRYTGFEDLFSWSVVDIFKLLASGVLTGVLLAVWDWARAT